MMIIVRVRGIHSEIVCLAPHPSRAAESHVKSFLSFIDILWIIKPRTMIQHSYLRGLSFWSLEVIYLCLVGVPNQAILYSYDFNYLGFWHRLHKIIFYTLPLFRFFAQRMKGQDIVSFCKLFCILPVHREILTLDVFKEPGLNLWMRLQVVETDKLQSCFSSIWCKNLDICEPQIFHAVILNLSDGCQISWRIYTHSAEEV